MEDGLETGSKLPGAQWCRVTGWRSSSLITKMGTTEDVLDVLRDVRSSYALLPRKTDGGAPAASTRTMQNDADTAPQPKPRPRALRSAAEHRALVQSLQEEHLADDLEPPDGSIVWTSETLNQWFVDGGQLTYKAVRLDSSKSINIDATETGTHIVLRNVVGQARHMS